MTSMKRNLAVPILTLALTLLALAQTPAPDGLVSPEVRPDRTVIFRVRAPQATMVTLFGDWMPVGKPEPMTKGADGVWSITTAPLEANGHLYWFNLDGLAVADPVNPRIKLRQRTSASLFEIPGGSPSAWDLRDVPHGVILTEFQKSAVLNRTERFVIYLPAGYEKGTTRYPVLYLVHGSGDVPESWTNAGNANLILDNLIADKKARPMIIVMPAGHAAPFGSRGGAAGDNTQLFDKYLTTEVIPFVDAKYRTAPGAKNRALAGLSMGGGHTINVGFTHPDLFSALGIFSPGLPQNFTDTYKTALADAKSTNEKLALIWISCGDQDTTVQYPRVKEFSEMLNGHGIHAKFQTYSGAHVWPVWRDSLTDFAPLLFVTK
jgi:enterochelin esterase-like enzyme